MGQATAGAFFKKRDQQVGDQRHGQIERAGGEEVRPEPTRHDHIGSRQGILRQLGNDQWPGEREGGAQLGAQSVRGGQRGVAGADHRTTAPGGGGGLEGALSMVVRPDPAGNDQETGVRNYFMGLMLKDLEVAIEEAAKFGARLPMVELIRDNALSTSGLEHPLGQPL